MTFSTEAEKIAWAHSLGRDELEVAWNADHTWFSRMAAMDGATDILTIARNYRWKLDADAVFEEALSRTDYDVLLWTFFMGEAKPTVLQKALAERFPWSSPYVAAGQKHVIPVLGKMACGQFTAFAEAVSRRQAQDDAKKREREGIDNERDLKRSWVKDHRWWCAYAAESGSLEVLELAKSRGWPLDRDVIFPFALLGGHLDIVRWVHDLKKPVSVRRALDANASEFVPFRTWKGF